mgnify:CR=1 FL=1
MTDKQIYQIGLTMINGVGDILARHLLEALGDAEAVFTEKRQSLEKISGIRLSPRLSGRMCFYGQRKNWLLPKRTVSLSIS